MNKILDIFKEFFCENGWHKLDKSMPYLSEMKGYCVWCKRFGLVDSKRNLHSLQSFEIYCTCGLELESSIAQVYDIGKGEYRYICPKCGTQSNWDFSPPVPILLKTFK